MSLSEDVTSDDLHPIDVVESLAEHHAWEFDRIGDDQIAMAVEGQWKTYSITLAWSGHDETLRLICTFEMDPPEDRLGALYETLNTVNDACWCGAFAYWGDQRLMTYRYGLLMGEGQTPFLDQIDRLIGTAVAAAERYYPAFQLVVWGGRDPENAMQVAIAEAYGRA